MFSLGQILLTLGARQTMDIIAQALLQEGDLVSVEDPGFPVAWSCDAISKYES